MNFMRVSWGMSAFVWGAVTVLCCIWWGWPATGVAVCFGVLPDIALIGGFAEGGRLKTERVRAYNALHSMPAPIALLGVGLIVLFVTGGFAGGFWPIAVAGVAWFVHIAADRAFGFGLRAPDGGVIPVGYRLQ